MKYIAYLSIGGKNQISIYQMDPDTGALAFQEAVATPPGPAPLATDPAQRSLYVGLRSSREIVSFGIDPSTGALAQTGSVSLEADPCYLSTDRKGNYLLSAYYSGGLAAVHPLDPDGAVGGPSIEWRSTAPKAHCIQTDPSNRFAFVPHVGESNFIAQFRFDESTGQLTPNDPPRLPAGEGQGPRHFCFHPHQKVLYFSNEQGSSVTAYRFASDRGTLTPFQTVSTLPDDFAEENTCAQIHITPNGRFLYVSNRGHDSIAGFVTDPENGQLTPIGPQPTEPTPRAFNVDPTGRFLFAGGLGTGVLASYRIDAEDGTLQPLETYPVGENPMWVLILGLPD